MKILVFFGPFLFFLSSLNALAQQPYIESLEGSDHVTVIHNGISQSGSEGDELAEKDQVQTDAQTSARISYPDGSSLVLSSEGSLEIESPEGSARSAHLISGTIQVTIEKADGNGPSQVHKFFIRTSSAVMGVRGTEFIVEEAGATQVHTLEGTVDVAKDHESLAQGRGLPLHRDEAVEATRAGVGTPQKFNRQQFMAQFRQKHPHLAHLRSRPLRRRGEIKSGNKGQTKKNVHENKKIKRHRWRK